MGGSKSTAAGANSLQIVTAFGRGVKGNHIPVMVLCAFARRLPIMEAYNTFLCEGLV